MPHDTDSPELTLDPVEATIGWGLAIAVLAIALGCLAVSAALTVAAWRWAL